MVDHSVIIVGGGPTGLMLAAELAIAGVDVAVVEKRVDQELLGTRAGGLHSRTLEILDQRGIVDRFIAAGQVHHAVHFHVPLEISDFPTRHNYVLALSQNHIERILASWVEELGVIVHRGHDALSATQREDSVDLSLSGGKMLRAGYLVGCDGGRSTVRKSAGIEFPGSDATTSWLIAEIQTSEEPRWGFHRDKCGVHAIGKADGGGARIVLTEAQIGHVQPKLSDIRMALVEIYGTDFGAHTATWISRFTDMTRQAAAYRECRILLAGDAAHIHPPMSGQGLNIGVQDAVNLGWKLARVIKGVSPDDLLDSYHTERHPVAARVLLSTMAQVALRRGDDRSLALDGMVKELLAMHEPRKRIVGEISGLDVHYDLGEGHPLIGRRMPDLDIMTPEGPSRVYSFLRESAFVLLDLNSARAADSIERYAQPRLVEARYEGPWILPVIGEIPAPSAVLVRPDGYVAWAISDAKIDVAIRANP